MKAFIKDILTPVVVALTVFAGCQFALQQVTVQQVSMLPNLEEGQRIFINKVIFFFHGPERGDIIVFKPQEGTGATPLIKRVIGLPGETIAVKSGLVYVNGLPLNEPYLQDVSHYTLEPLTVPANHYFVLGDNRNNSNDSHYGWTVPQAGIIGKAWVSIWPPEKWGLIPTYAYASE